MKKKNFEICNFEPCQYFLLRHPPLQLTLLPSWDHQTILKSPSELMICHSPVSIKKLKWMSNMFQSIILFRCKDSSSWRFTIHLFLLTKSKKASKHWISLWTTLFWKIPMADYFVKKVFFNTLPPLRPFFYPITNPRSPPPPHRPLSS